MKDIIKALLSIPLRVFWTIMETFDEIAVLVCSFSHADRVSALMRILALGRLQDKVLHVNQHMFVFFALAHIMQASEEEIKTLLSQEEGDIKVTVSPKELVKATLELDVEVNPITPDFVSADDGAELADLETISYALQYIEANDIKGFLSEAVTDDTEATLVAHIPEFLEKTLWGIPGDTAEYNKIEFIISTVQEHLPRHIVESGNYSIHLQDKRHGVRPVLVVRDGQPIDINEYLD